MGALQKIRSKSTLLVGVIAVGLLAFVVPWGEITQFLNVSKNKAFVVNGDVIRPDYYMQRIEQLQNLEKLKYRDGQLNEQQLAQLREQVFTTIVTEKTLDDQAARLGLSVTDAELNEMVHGVNISPILYEIPYFVDPQTGQFSRAALNEFLTIINEDYTANPAMQFQQEELQQIWTYVENRMRYNRLEEKYASLVAGSVLVNDVEAKAYYQDSKDVANLAYITKDYEDIEDSTIEVSDTEIQDLYNVRKENFLAKYPSSYLTYFVKNVTPSEADYQDIEHQMAEVKEELSATANPGMIVNQYSTRQYIDAHIAITNLHPEIRSFVENSAVGDIYGPIREDRAYTMYKYVARTTAPDSVKIQTIPVQSFDPTLASAIADSLQNVLANGKDFIALAEELYPNMPGVGTSNWYDEVQLSSIGIGEQCFTATKGSVIKVEINGTTSLLKIDDITRPVQKVKYAEITMPVIVSDKTNNAIDNEINKFISDNQNTSEFEKTALSSGYNVIADAVIYPSNSGLENVLGTRDIIKWAFNDKEIGKIKKFETNDARIVAIVTGNTKEGYLPVNNKEVKELLKAELVKDKKAEKMIADLQSKDLSSLSSLAQSLDTKIDTAKFVSFQTSNINGVGYEPIMNVYSKSGSLNVTTQPVKGNKGVYVLNVADKSEEVTEYNSDMVKQMIASNYMQMLSYSASYTLINKMDVEDNRVKFF